MLPLAVYSTKWRSEDVDPQHGQQQVAGSEAVRLARGRCAGAPRLHQAAAASGSAQQGTRTSRLLLLTTYSNIFVVCVFELVNVFQVGIKAITAEGKSAKEFELILKKNNIYNSESKGWCRILGIIFYAIDIFTNKAVVA